MSHVVLELEDETDHGQIEDIHQEDQGLREDVHSLVHVKKDCSVHYQYHGQSDVQVYKDDAPDYVLEKDVWIVLQDDCSLYPEMFL